MNGKDLISRQDAIDAIVKQLGIKDESFLTEQEKTIVKVLRGMPSVQPEENLKPCKNCRRNQMIPDWYEEVYNNG